jgi:Fe-S-cluster containining protein
MNSSYTVKENLDILSRKWNIPKEVYDLHIGNTDNVIDTYVKIDGVIFHIPTITKNRRNHFILWKCLWPDCHNCCEKVRLPLLKDDLKPMARKLGYDNLKDFISKETTVTSWNQTEDPDIIVTITMVTLKRRPDERQNEVDKMLRCRFLNDSGCSIHPDKPSVCHMYPFNPWIQTDEKGRIEVHSKFAFTGDCPGFYIDESIDSMLDILKDYSPKIYKYCMATRRSNREGYSCFTNFQQLDVDKWKNS